MQGTGLDKMNDGGSDVLNLSEGSTTTASANVPNESSKNGNSGAGSSGGADTGSGTSDSSPQYVVFTETSNALVFLTDQERPEILYTVTDDTSLNYLIWEAWDGNKYAPISNATFVSKDSVKIDGPFAEVTREGATLNFTSFHSTRASFTNNAMRLIMNFDVDAENLTGNSSSEFFAVVDTSAAKTDASAVVSSANAQSPTAEVVSSATATATGTSNNTGGNTGSTDTESTTSASTTNNSKPSKGGGGGLATGAIAGIAVGAIIGAIIIGAMIWFFLRKRRQNKKLAGGYTATDSGNAYIVDKETHGRTTDSPNSPYSDENGTHNIPIESTRDEPAIAPVERGLPRTSTGGSQGGRSASRAETPQGVSTNVAHLVEDGMTADEIRRLEEEERQLDDEIERAARR